jgi:hypothetical protein
MKRLTAPVIVVALVAALGVIAAIAAAAGGAFSGAPPSDLLARVSNQGKPSAIQAAVKQRMGLDGYSSISEVAARNGERYLRFSGGDSNDCYGNGAVAGALPVGVIKCVNAAPFFPSASKPILDLSVVEVDSQGSSSFVRVGGIAADGVAQIGIENAAGDIVQTIPVIGNVYDSSAIKAGTVASLVPLNQSGAIAGPEASRP